VVIASGHDPGQERHALVLNNNDPVKLQANPPLFFSVAMHYRVIKVEGKRRRWKVSTVAYAYAVYIIREGKQCEVLSYHWHPRTTPQHSHPHLHVGEAAQAKLLEKLHLPTRRVSIEELLRFFITELKVKTLRSDWKDVLAKTQELHEEFPTWS
jgi:hypothetical protein